ncbi:hypothetical protein [Nostoc sp.]|uniref:hypothetical protein n=1 Tax=Nostoc sp. TaxID=1180 RepID=UPI002FFA2826
MVTTNLFDEGERESDLDVVMLKRSRFYPSLFLILDPVLHIHQIARLIWQLNLSSQFDD